MFEIRVMVEDKKLGEALSALDGIVVMSSIGITRVKNAAVRSKGNVKKVVEANPSNGVPMYMRAFNQLVQDNNLFPTSRSMGAVLAGFGGSPSSAPAAFDALVKNGYARKKGRGEYALIVRPDRPLPSNGVSA